MTRPAASRNYLALALAMGVGALFLALTWPLAMLTLAGLNAVAAVALAIGGDRRTAGFAVATAALLIAALAFTDWAFSSIEPVVRPAWTLIVIAGIAELAAIVSWFCGALRLVEASPP